MPVKETFRPDLLFIMSFRLSLTKWRDAGMFDRETALLNAFLDSGVYTRIHVFSYEPDDAALLTKLKASGDLRSGIEVIVPSRQLAFSTMAFLYSLVAGMTVHKQMRPGFVIRTNQISGAWVGFLARWSSGRPLILRCGYSLSKRFALQGKGLRAALAWIVEYLCLKSCRVCLVSSLDVLEYYSRWKPRQAIVLAPTFVETSLFQPRRPLDFNTPVLYVGRLEPQKNVESLIKACAVLGRALTVVGDGSLRQPLEALAKETGTKATFHGVLPNHTLPDIMREHAVYALPSNFDPMPKTLIEAMASGMVCVSSPTKGGVELLRDGESGYLSADFSAKAIANALKRAFAESRTEVGDAARRHVEENNTLPGFVRREAGIIRQLVEST